MADGPRLQARQEASHHDTFFRITTERAETVLDAAELVPGMKVRKDVDHAAAHQLDVEGAWLLVMLLDEAVDGSLQIYNGMENAALQPLPGGRDR
ncbi:MAG: hypothetical protein ACSLE1_22340 [Sphingobium sp.]